MAIGVVSATDPVILSVLIITKNRLSFLKQSLRSVSQRSSKVEVIVLDNGSSDCTWNWLKLQPSIRSYRDLSPNLSTARNILVSHARGYYCLVLDSDDLIIEGAIAKIIEHIELEKDAFDFGYGDIKQADTELNYTVDVRYPNFHTHAEFSNAILSNARIPFKHSGLVFCKNYFDKINGYCELFDRKQDIYLVLMMLAKGANFHKFPFPVAIHRKHPQQLSSSRIRNLEYWYRLTDKFESNHKKKTFLKLKRTVSETVKLFLEVFESISFDFKQRKNKCHSSKQ